MSEQLVDDIYKNDLVEDIEFHLRAASKLNDRLAFGSYRPELASQLKTQLEIARNKIDNLLRRLQ